MKCHILVLLFVSSFVRAQGELYPINDALIKHKENLDVHLFMDESGFKIEHNGQIKNIENAFVDPILKNLKKQKKLDAFFEKGCSIVIKEMNNGEFRLQSAVPGFGGGPVLGAIFYWGTKVACYGGLLATTGVITTATMGAAAVPLAAVGGTALASVAAAGVGTGIAGAATGAVSLGIGATATGAAACASTAVAGAAAAGSAAGLVAGIESASTTMLLIGTLIPWI